MQPRDFCYWLQGFFEVSGASTISAEQAAVIKEHLQLVFSKETTLEVKSKWPQHTFGGVTTMAMGEEGGASGPAEIKYFSNHKDDSPTVSNQSQSGYCGNQFMPCYGGLSDVANVPICKSVSMSDLFDMEGHPISC